MSPEARSTPWVCRRTTHHGIPASLLPGRCTPLLLLPVYTVVTARYMKDGVVRRAVIPPLLKRRGSCRLKGGLSSSRNNPLSQQKQAGNGKETRYRKECFTRVSGIL